MLTRTLRRDIYSLEALGYSIKNVKLLVIDLLVVLRYLYIY
jgi:hypothetical protein